MVLLSQFLGLHAWIGIAVVVLANAAAVATSRRPAVGEAPPARRPVAVAASAA